MVAYLWRKKWPTCLPAAKKHPHIITLSRCFTVFTVKQLSNLVAEAPGGPYAAKGRFIAVHDLGQVSSTPVLVFFGLLKPFLLHLDREQRLHSSHSVRHVRALL